jgi:hypothetical protein
MATYLFSLFGYKTEKIEPIVVPKICGKCFEAGSKKRKCCNAIFCDHCYTKDKACPFCGTATKMEKMTGATYMVPAFSEHEECRTCLDPGTKRRCCGNYYCDDCYYKVPNCRSCEKPVGKKGGMTEEMKATIIAIVIGWLVTFFILAAIFTFFGYVISSENQTPVGISDYNCYGIFKKCDHYMCVDVEDNVVDGSVALPSISSWQQCDDSSTTKLEGYSCIFDEELWTATNGNMGFDICKDQFAEGVYIFEDTFESWHNYSIESNTMKSATWDDVVNGYSTPFCGVGKYLGGEKALTFSGSFERSATTKPLDLTSGGWIEAELFISPIGYDVSNSNCKSSYAGIVHVEYSIDTPDNWTEIIRYTAADYASSEFFMIRLDLPERAVTNHTRVRFVQSAFQAARDAWALDNVRILRYLPLDWYSNEEYQQNIKVGESLMQEAQCCFDTDWCEYRLTAKEMSECEYPWYESSVYLLRGAELYIIITTLLTVFKLVYVSGQDFLMTGRMPLQDEYDDLLDFERLMMLIPPKYRPKKRLEDFTKNIHRSARLVGDLKDMFNDEEGEGEMQKTKEEKAEIRRKEKERIKAEKKKLKSRQSKKAFRNSIISSEELKRQEQELASSSSDEDLDKDMDVTFGTDQVATDTDKFKRQNVAMLKHPFNVRVSNSWRRSFGNVVFGVFGLLLLIKITTTSYYVVHQSLHPFNRYHSSISVTSLGVNFFAMCVDLKELYYIIKNVVPLRDRWLPLITVDNTEDVNTLYINDHQVLLSDISDSSTFSIDFITACAVAYLLAAFPWCLMSLILRDNYLNFKNMRVVSPMFALIMLSRALLGPSFIIKIVFSLQVLLDPNMKNREAIGVAFQKDSTRDTAINTALVFVIATSFIIAIIAFDFVSMAAGVALLLGIFYGSVSGNIHLLLTHLITY